MVELKDNKYVEINEESEAGSASDNLYNSNEINRRNLKEFLPWFWAYYKWWVIVPALIIAVIISFVVSIAKSRKDYYLNIALVNAQVADVERFDNLITDYENMIGSEIEINYDDAFRHALKTDDEYFYDDSVSAQDQRLIGMLVNGQLDLSVMNTRCIDDLYAGNHISNLEEILPDDVFENLEGKIYYIDGTPVGIAVDAFTCFDDVGYREGDTYYVIVPKTTDKLSEAVAFIENYLG